MTKEKSKAIGVVVLPDSTISTIGKLRDNISNNQSSSLGKWAFESKLYRENPGSITTGTGSSSRFLFTMVASQDPSSIYCVIDDTSTVLTGDFERMLKTQFQSLWLLRQTTRADGKAYNLNNGEVILRMANMFIQGGFKGLVLQLETEVSISTESIEEEQANDALNRINKVLQFYELNPITQLVYNDMDLAKVYANALGNNTRKA